MPPRKLQKSTMSWRAHQHIRGSSCWCQGMFLEVRDQNYSLGSYLFGLVGYGAHAIKSRFFAKCNKCSQKIIQILFSLLAEPGQYLGQPKHELGRPSGRLVDWSMSCTVSDLSPQPQRGGPPVGIAGPGRARAHSRG